MELLHGLNLRDLVECFGAVPQGRVIYVLAQVCESLAEAHARGLVHRDIKPANVYLCDRGGVPDSVKVLDFGLVRLYGDAKDDKRHITGVQEMVGTPWFMSPEAIKNSARSDPRSDVYAVGALGYYLLTTQLVFEAHSVIEVYEKQLTESPKPPRQRTTNPVTAELERVILRCLEKNPDLRPQTVTDLRTLLLASPRALEWGPDLRSDWWARYHSQGSGAAPETRPLNPGGPGSAVDIDLVSRIG